MRGKAKAAKERKAGREKARAELRARGRKVVATVKNGSQGNEEWERVDPPNMDPKFGSMLDKMNPKQVALFCAWIINGRNISGAARQIGYSPSYARRMFTELPAFIEAKEYVDQILAMEDAEWIDCLPQARQTLRSLLMAKDEKVRYLAAKDIVDRAEGKPTTRVDMTVREDRPSLTDGQLQLAFSIMQATGVGFAEAVAHIRAHPEEAERWIAQNATGSGRDVSALPETTGSHGGLQAPEAPEAGKEVSDLPVPQISRNARESPESVVEVEDGVQVPSDPPRSSETPSRPPERVSERGSETPKAPYRIQRAPEPLIATTEMWAGVA